MEHEQLFAEWAQKLETDPTKLDYQMPDPDWDYATLWRFIYEYLKPEFENLIKELAKVESATTETDKAVLVRLQWLSTYIERCKTYLVQPTEHDQN